MRKTILLVIHLLFAASLVAQGPREGGSDPGRMPFNFTGQVTDEESGLPVEFATVSLYSTADSALVDGGITDGEGKFQFRIRPGNYYARIQSVAYQQRDIQDITIARGQPARLGAITLSTSTRELEAVTVQGERTQMELALDKKVYNIGKDLSNLGGSAADILDNLPSVQVDVEGNISLRGSDNVRVLIDGKPSGLVGLSSNDALRQLNSNLIERVISYKRSWSIS